MARNEVVTKQNDIEALLPANIVKLHAETCEKGNKTYFDPGSGLVVQTRMSHIARGRCCGSGCRHCPYGHINVPQSIKKTTVSRDSRVAHSAVYTKTGDKGASSLFTGERRRKSDRVFDVLGTVDELNSFVGVAKEYLRPQQPSSSQVLVMSQLVHIQDRLLDVGSIVATPSLSGSSTYHPEMWTVDLERVIDELDAALTTLQSFILPGGSIPSAHLHVCRSTCRRAEREVVALLERSGSAYGPQLESACVYLNRLSDFFFVAARCMATDEELLRGK